MPKKEYKLNNRYNTYEIKDCLDEALTEVFCFYRTISPLNYFK